MAVLWLPVASVGVHGRRVANLARNGEHVRNLANAHTPQGGGWSLRTVRPFTTGKRPKAISDASQTSISPRRAGRNAPRPKRRAFYGGPPFPVHHRAFEINARALQCHRDWVIWATQENVKRRSAFKNETRKRCFGNLTEISYRKQHIVSRPTHHGVTQRVLNFAWARQLGGSSRRRRAIMRNKRKATAKFGGAQGKASSHSRGCQFSVG